MRYFKAVDTQSIECVCGNIVWSANKTKMRRRPRVNNPDDVLIVDSCEVCLGDAEYLNLNELENAV